MKKVLGIDYGTKRVGIAISDSSQIIASALCTVPNKEIFKFLLNLMKKEEIDKIVVGDAKNLDGSDTDSTKEIKLFVEKLQKLFPKNKVLTFDERFTSKIALQSLFDSGIKRNKRQNKSLIDKVSATIILQDYLSYK